MTAPAFLALPSDKILFLDLDGVVNSLDWWHRRGPRRKLGHDPVYEIDPRAVARLNEIVDRTGADVVISSAWRKLHSLPDIARYLEQRGFRGRVVGVTPTLPFSPRGHEIASWLRDHPYVRRFVILDDDADMADRKSVV